MAPRLYKWVTARNDRYIITEVDYTCKIILNQVYCQTVNQKFIREATNDKAQVFAVDVWRLERIANGLYKDNYAMQNKALLSEVIYTLAAASVLTEGNLPVYVTEDTESLVVAQSVMDATLYNCC